MTEVRIGDKIFEVKWDKTPTNGRERQIARLQLKAYQEGHRLANIPAPAVTRQFRRQLARKASNCAFQAMEESPRLRAIFLLALKGLDLELKGKS